MPVARRTTVLAAAVTALCVAALLTALYWSNSHTGMTGTNLRLSLHLFLCDLAVVFSTALIIFVLAVWFASDVRARLGVRVAVSIVLVIGALVLHYLALQVGFVIAFGTFSECVASRDKNNLPLLLITTSTVAFWIHGRRAAK